jgi:poly(A) polymerase
MSLPASLDQAAAARLLERPGVGELMQALNRDGAAARLVGGAVRNALIGADDTDIDIATTLPPDQAGARLTAAGWKVVPTGIAHGTVTAVKAGRAFEVTTLRRDVETDGRHAVVAFTQDFAEDALRRDFTINQLSLDATGAVHDHAGGLADLAARRVRFIGEPQARITEDYLRILRFFRFSAQYGQGALDHAGLSACAELASGMARLSRERVWAELKKLLVAPRAVEVMASLLDRGVWRHMAPLPADLATFTAASALDPARDAMTGLAALCLRAGPDPAALDGAFRLANSERKRLDAAAGARAFLLATGRLDERAWLGAAFRFGADGARDGLLTLAQGLNASTSAHWLALPAPVSPFRGADVLALGVPPGPAVGRVIAAAEAAWEMAGFPPDGAADFLTRAAAQG